MPTPHPLGAAALSVVLAACLLAPSAAQTGPSAGRWERSATPVFRHARLLNDIAPTAMLQDRDGLIWIGSQTGLVSWDGYRSRQYIADPNVAGSLPAAFVNALHEDRQGRLWVGTDSGGLARLDKESGRFASLATGPQGLSNARVFSLADDGAGGLWVGTAQGLDRLDTASGRVRRHTDGSLPPGLSPQRISALLRDSRGNLWVGTYQGLHLLAAGAPAFQALPMGSASIEVRRLAEDSEGRVWVGTRDSGAFVVEPGTTTARQLQDSARSDGKPVVTDWVSAIVDVGEHRVWLGTWGQGIVEVDTRTWATRRLRHDAEVPASLAQDTVLALLRDRSGLVWASGPSLLDSHDPAQRVVSTWYGSGGRLLGGARTQIDAVLARQDGTVWLGNLSGGIDIVPPDGGPSQRLMPRDGEPLDALPNASVIALADAPDGSVYVGTSKGLYRARDGGRRIERMAFRGLAPNTQIKDLCVSGDQLWMGVTPGLRHVDLSAPDAEAAVVPGLQQDDIMTVTCDPGEALWVGTSTGLVRYWPASATEPARIERPWPEAPGHVGLPSSSVSSVVRDARGRLWVAFYGGGVRVVEPQPGADVRVHRIGPEQGLTHNAANALLLDTQGNAWVSTDDGLLRIDGRTLAATSLQQADGVGLLGYWQAAADITPQGDLLFGSNGLTVVHPDEFRPRGFKAPIALTDAEGRRVPATGIRLDPAQRAVQVSFALLDYAAPERTRYAYRLAGLEEGWTDSPAELRIARYTNVPPGDYTLEVKATNGAGEEVLARWPLQVQPAWHETTTFRALLAALALALVAGLVRLRTRLLEHRAAMLREQVAQRTQELQQRSDELRRSEKRLEQLAYHDSLTGLANRRLFNDEMQRLVAQARRGDVFALMLLDLDRFKPINDAHGHDAGDAVLVAVGARLVRALREVDLVARLGGDEFAVLLRDPAGREGVDIVCRRVIESIAEPVSYKGIALQVGTSIGVALCPAEAQGADTLYKSADLALYAAKQAGRGAWRWGSAHREAISGEIDVEAPADSGMP
ncbi:MAG: diguanylate cyclase [Burkholderiales bacterium]